MAVFPQFCILLSLLLLCSLIGGIVRPANAEKSWCVAKPSGSEEDLQANIDYACAQWAVTCDPFSHGGPCFSPNTKAQHASFAMNLFYQIQKTQPNACSFKKTALIALTNPSLGSCIYIAEEGPVQKSKTWCVAKPGTDEATFQANINDVCEKVDYKDIQEGGPCFTTNTLLNHALYAMNLFYNTLGNGQDCDFKNTGLIVVTYPSYDMCNYM